MKKLAILILAGAASLMAADCSGIWNGTGSIPSQKYGQIPLTAQLTLIQDGANVSGTFKSGNGKVSPLTAGAVSGTQVKFAVGGGRMTAVLNEVGGQLVGTMTSSRGEVVNLVFTKQP